MPDGDKNPRFLLGNVLMGLSLVSLFFLGSLWELLGPWAMALWMGLAGLGGYFLMAGKGPSSMSPD